MRPPPAHPFPAALLDSLSTAAGEALTQTMVSGVILNSPARLKVRDHPRPRSTSASGSSTAGVILYLGPTTLGRATHILGVANKPAFLTAWERCAHLLQGAFTKTAIEIVSARGRLLGQCRFFERAGVGAGSGRA